MGDQTADSAAVAALVQGAGRGIGLALTRRLLEGGGFRQVVATSRDPAASPGLAELAAQWGARLRTEALELTDEESVADLGARLRNSLGPLGLVLNVSGLLHGDGQRPEKRLEDVEAAALARSFAVNAAGPLLVVIDGLGPEDSGGFFAWDGQPIPW